jgi:hypothetical protein
MAFEAIGTARAEPAARLDQGVSGPRL